jgi:membrane-associated HD superfamily phosphohydrolase
MDLIFKYFNYELINLQEIRKNIVIDKEEEEEEEKEEEKEEKEEKSRKKQIFFFKESIVIDKVIKILYNLETIDKENKKISNNQILLTSCNLNFLEDFIKNSLRFDTIIIYDNKNNNLCIFTLRELSIFLMYNDNISNNYTIISIYNSSVYGKIINKDLINYLLLKTFGIINKITEPFKPTLRNSQINKYLLEFKNYILTKEVSISIKFDNPPPLKLSYSNMPSDFHHSSSFDFDFTNIFRR